jgi:hypothetical protein
MNYSRPATVLIFSVFLSGGFSCGKTGSSDPDPFDIEFEVQSSAPIGALEFEIAYDADDGEFDGASGKVDCTASGVDSSAFNHRAEQHRILGAVVSVDGIPATAAIATCRFDYETSGSPRNSDFDLAVTRAVSPVGVAIFPMPTLRVSEVREK